MNEVIMRLKDYKGYHIFKYKDSDHWEYLLCDPEEDEVINVYKSLKELKEDNS